MFRSVFREEVAKISMSEGETLQRKRSGKAVGPGDIPIGGYGSF